MICVQVCEIGLKHCANHEIGAAILTRTRCLAHNRSRSAFAKPLPATFAEQNELYQTGLKRLAFLHMQTGGAPRPTSGSRTIYSKGTKVEVKPADKVDPSLVGGSDKAPYSNWHGGNLDPESVQKHQRLLKRAGFKNNADAIGNGGVF